MSPLLQSFEDRALELSAYHKFIELIEKDSATLSFWYVRSILRNIAKFNAKKTYRK